MAKQIAHMAVKLTANASGFHAEVAKAAQRTKGLEAQMRGMAKSTRAMWSTMQGTIAALGIQRMISFTKDLVKQFDDIGDAADKFGLGVKQFYAFSKSAEALDADIEVLSRSLNFMAKNLSGISEESKAVQDGLGAIGIEARSLRGLGFDTMFMRVFEGMAKTEDPIVRTAAAFKIFGRSAGELTKLLAHSPKELNEMMKEMATLSTNINEQTISSADTAKKEMVKLSATWDNLKANVLKTGLPEKLIRGLSEEFRLLSDVMNGNSRIAKMVARDYLEYIPAARYVYALGDAWAYVKSKMPDSASVKQFGLNTLNSALGAPGPYTLKPSDTDMRQTAGVDQSKEKTPSTLGRLWEGVKKFAPKVAGALQSTYDKAAAAVKAAAPKVKQALEDANTAIIQQQWRTAIEMQKRRDAILDMIRPPEVDLKMKIQGLEGLGLSEEQRNAAIKKFSADTFGPRRAFEDQFDPMLKYKHQLEDLKDMQTQYGLSESVASKARASYWKELQDAINPEAAKPMADSFAEATANAEAFAGELKNINDLLGKGQQVDTFGGIASARATRFGYKGGMGGGMSDDWTSGTIIKPTQVTPTEISTTPIPFNQGGPYMGIYAEKMLPLLQQIAINTNPNNLQYAGVAV